MDPLMEMYLILGGIGIPLAVILLGVFMVGFWGPVMVSLYVRVINPVCIIVLVIFVLAFTGQLALENYVNW